MGRSLAKSSRTTTTPAAAPGPRVAAQARAAGGGLAAVRDKAAPGGLGGALTWGVAWGCAPHLAFAGGGARRARPRPPRETRVVRRGGRRLRPRGTLVLDDGGRAVAYPRTDGGNPAPRRVGGSAPRRAVGGSVAALCGATAPSSRWTRAGARGGRLLGVPAEARAAAARRRRRRRRGRDPLFGGLRGGELFAWGDGSAGQLGLGDEPAALAARGAPALVPWPAAAAPLRGLAAEPGKAALAGAKILAVGAAGTCSVAVVAESVGAGLDAARRRRAAAEVAAFGQRSARRRRAVARRRAAARARADRGARRGDGVRHPAPRRGATARAARAFDDDYDEAPQRREARGASRSARTSPGPDDATAAEDLATLDAALARADAAARATSTSPPRTGGGRAGVLCEDAASLCGVAPVCADWRRGLAAYVAADARRSPAPRRRGTRRARAPAPAPRRRRGPRRGAPRGAARTRPGPPRTARASAPRAAPAPAAAPEPAPKKRKAPRKSRAELAAERDAADAARWRARRWPEPRPRPAREARRGPPRGRAAPRAETRRASDAAPPPAPEAEPEAEPEPERPLLASQSEPTFQAYVENLPERRKPPRRSKAALAPFPKPENAALPPPKKRPTRFKSVDEGAAA
ncbi:ubiquitin-protein transferase [Aureococcus anophagefferens]|nr:ubiquitin-protein transferase [Aureococcus anophagefferens]